MKTVLIFCTTIILAVLAGCSSSQEPANLSPEDRFIQAKKLYDDGDYLEAINAFTVITLQYQGSSSAGEAQFYLGECRFARGEYLLASFEYQQLIRNMPANPRVPDAQYKVGLCFYNLSPNANLDQQYTSKAIEELQTFVEYYPANPHAVEAERLIKELTTRLARKSYEIARQYATLDYYKSAIFYYDDVIEKYHDTEYAPMAFIGKTEMLISHRKYNEAYSTIKLFLEKYPNSPQRESGEQLKRSIEEKLSVSNPVSGKDARTGPQAGSGFTSH